MRSRTQKAAEIFSLAKSYDIITFPLKVSADDNDLDAVIEIESFLKKISETPEDRHIRILSLGNDVAVQIENLIKSTTNNQLKKMVTPLLETMRVGNGQRTVQGREAE